MTKTLKASSKKLPDAELRDATKVVRDPHSSRPVIVKGLGAMKDRPLKLKKGVDLLRPIYEQVLRRRSKTHAAE